LLFVASCSSSEGTKPDGTNPDGGRQTPGRDDSGADEDDGGPGEDGDGGAPSFDKQARVLSVAPTYTLAQETYKYRPKASSAEQPTWQVESGPKGLKVEADGTTVSWTPGSDQKGKHSVTLKTKVNGYELTQSGEITVAVAEERAAVDVDESSGGSAIVTAPKSRVAGASVAAKAKSLKDSTRLTISEVDTAPSMGISKAGPRAVQFGPSGTVFSEPALITLPLGDEGVKTKSRVGAFVYDTKGRWVRVPVVSVDTDKGVVHAKAKHFSLYAAAETKLGLSVAATAAPESGACAGDLFVSAWVEEPVTELVAAQISNLSETLVARAADGDLASLLGQDSVAGSFRFVRVVELGQSVAGDRLLLESRLLVSTLYLPGDGSAQLTHTDALGHLLGTFHFAVLRDSLPEIWTHLSGRAVRAVFDHAPSANLALSARLHALYFEGDASLEPVSADDLGFALVDMDEVRVDKPALDARDGDLDCDGLVKAFDAMDDRLLPRIVTRPLGVVSAVAGHAARLSALLLNGAGSGLSWHVVAGTASLAAVASDETARDFVATKAGRYLVEVSADVAGEPLVSAFAIDVSPELELPRCVPSPDRSTLKEGESVALSAVLAESSLPATSLEVKWGALVEGAFSASSELDPRGYEARFTPRTAGRFALACRVVQGAREGAAGDTSIDVVSAQNNLPPTDLTLSPSYETLVVGQTLTFAAQAKDPEAGPLQFGWSASGGSLGTPQTVASGSRVSFSATQPALYEVRVQVEDGAGAAANSHAFVLVVAKASDTDGEDKDNDGWPSGLDCNDQDAKIHPGANDRCGDAIDDDCSGTPANSDCDADGYSVEQGDCDDANRNVNPRAAERCDGVDNDCDAQRDEGFSVGTTCSVGRGQCEKTGLWACSADGFGVVCPVSPLRAQPEICDGIDNDCDGARDEELPARDVSCGVGACVARGVSSCKDGKEQSSCQPLPPALADLTCDGVDDDCSGQADEDVVKLAEVCNGRDDNCDKRVDEGLSCSGTVSPTCTPSGPEKCNGLDDDCNGRFDENDVCGATAQVGSLLGVYWDCGDAACSSLADGGIMFLANGSGLNLQTFDQGSYDPSLESYCVDNSFQYTVVGDQLSMTWVGDDATPKSASGTFRIAGAHLSVTFSSGPADMIGSHELVRTPEHAGGACPRGPVCSAHEICGNGFDDNCNGKDDKSDPDCVACTGASTPEVCDQLDNNCNGVVDDLGQSCIAESAQGVCRVGKLVCPAQGTQPSCVAGSADPQGEMCQDGLDNDCDGAIDEAGCTPLSPGETCFNPIDVTAGGVFTFEKGSRNDVQGGCRPDYYVDRVFYLQTPGGINGQYVVTLDSTTKMDVGGVLYKAPAGYVPGTSCPGMPGSSQYCVGGRAASGGSPLYLDPASTYLLVVEAAPDAAVQGGSIRLSVARSNDGSCVPGDADADGTSICAGDCHDADPAIHPGAGELCNALDDDCDGLIDEQDGTCATGLLGVCAVGLTECSQSPACQPIQRSTRDYCGDGVDNDCNGVADDNCVDAAGEACDNAIELGLGGAISGTLAGASDDAVSRCGFSGAERFYRFSVPAGGSYVTLSESQQRGAVSYTLYKDCALNVVTCAFKSQWLEQGTYRLAVESGGGAQAYAFTLGIGDGQNCLTPDLDGDGATACYADCDESRASVNRNVAEGSTCDGIDQDCNGMVDDVKATCSVPGLLGVCATGALRCDPKLGSGSCSQVMFPDALGRDICGDGLDNDCDGAADAQDPQLCVSVPPGDVCGLALQSSLTGGGVFQGTLAGYGDDVALGCGDYAAAGGGSNIERFYSLTLSEKRVLRIEARTPNAAGGTGPNYVGVAQLDSCAASASTGGVQCAGSYFNRELPAGTYTFAVFGPAGQDYTLLVSSRLPNDDTGASCSPADLDGDGVTLCNGDCLEGNAGVHPGGQEVCDGLDNDCNMMVDDQLPGTTQCAVGGASGDCAQGMLNCVQGAMRCVGPKPGEKTEVCNDGRDNDCDGPADDTGTPGVDCMLQTGETCQDAVPIGNGFFDGSLSGAKNDGNGCYGGTQGLAEERYYVFNVPTPGFYYMQLRAMGPGPFPPHSAGIYEGACAPSMYNDGCNVQGNGVAYYHLTTPGPHYVVVESDDPFNYKIGLATTNGSGQCMVPDSDGDGYDLCEFDCDEGNPYIYPGRGEVCNGLDDNCDGAVDEGC
jgi:hypothetical protein